MKLKYAIKYIAAPSRIIMYLMLLVAGITILQFIIPGVISISFPVEYAYSHRPPEPELTEAEKQQIRIDEARKEFMSDGTIHILIRSNKESEGTYWSEMQVLDVNENLLWSGTEKREEKYLPYEYLSWPWCQSIGGNPGFIARQVITPVFSQAFVVPVIQFKDQITQYWRYEPGERYFVGVDARGRKIGYAGSNGIREFSGQVKPFQDVACIDAWCPDDSYSPVLMWQTKHQLYEINFQAGTVRLVFDAQDKEIVGVFMFNWLPLSCNEKYLRSSGIDTSKCRPTMRIDTTNSEHYLLLRDPNEEMVFRTPGNWDLINMSIAATKEKIYLKYRGAEESRSGSYQKWVELYQVESTGDLKLLNRFEWPYPQRQRFDSPGGYQEDWFDKARYYVKTVSSPVFDLALLWSYKKMTYSGERGKLSDFIITLIDKDDYYLMTNRPINWILSLMMACIALWHGWPRRTSWGKLFVWLIVVGVFNLAGLLAYLALNHTAVIKCPVCGKRRGLERVDCVRCGVELPVPERRKLDLIFDL